MKRAEVVPVANTSTNGELSSVNPVKFSSYHCGYLRAPCDSIPMGTRASGS